MEQLVNILLSKGWTPGATGIWLIAGMFMIYLLREWRETRKLSAEDRQARREGYAAQVESLMSENRGLRADLTKLHSEHEEYRRLCHLENDQLRNQVVNLQDEVTGLKRQMASNQISSSRRRRPPETIL